MTGLGLCLACATAMAAPPLPDNLLECVNRGFGLQKCKLMDRQLGDSLIEDDQIYEGTLLVHYDFPCTGHPVQLGVKVGDGTKFFSMGVINGLLTVNGTGDLMAYDPTPEVTRSLTFNTACRLHVTEVKLLPSTVTIQMWTLQNESQRTIIRLANDRYQLALDLENLLAWSVDKLTNFRDAMVDLVEANPGNRQFQTLLDSVNLALRGESPTATLEELRDAELEVIATLLAELEEEQAKGQHLIDRFARWQLEIPRSLQDAVDDAAHTIHPH
jgi:hypothetical protein